MLVVREEQQPRFAGGVQPTKDFGHGEGAQVRTQREIAIRRECDVAGAMALEQQRARTPGAQCHALTGIDAECDAQRLAEGQARRIRLFRRRLGHRCPPASPSTPDVACLRRRLRLERALRRRVRCRSPALKLHARRTDGRPQEGSR